MNQPMSLPRWGERGSTTIQYVGLTAATAALLIVLIFTFQTRGGVVAQSVVEVFQCHIMSFMGGGTCSGTTMVTQTSAFHPGNTAQLVLAQAAPGNIWDSITSTLGDWWNDFTSWWNGLPGWGKALVVVGAIVVVVVAVIAAVKLGAVAAAAAALKAIGLALKGAVVWIARTAIPAIGRWLAQVAWPAIVSAAKAVASLAVRFGTAIVNGVRAAASAVWSVVTAVGNRIGQFVTRAIANFRADWVANLTKMVVNTVLAALLEFTLTGRVTIWTIILAPIAYGIVGMMGKGPAGAVAKALFVALGETIKKILPALPGLWRHFFGGSQPPLVPTPAPTPPPASPTPSPSPTPPPASPTPSPSPTPPPASPTPSPSPTPPPASPTPSPSPTPPPTRPTPLPTPTP